MVLSIGCSLLAVIQAKTSARPSQGHMMLSRPGLIYYFPRSIGRSTTLYAGSYEISLVHEYLQGNAFARIDNITLF